MPSHMSDIGFPVDSEEHFQHYASLAIVRGQPLESRNGIYIRWSLGSGAELWMQGDHDQSFVGMNPHFAGNASLRVRLLDAVPGRVGNPLEGVFLAETLSSQQPPARFTFAVPDFELHSSLEFPLEVDLQLSAFAHTLEVSVEPAPSEVHSLIPLSIGPLAGGHDGPAPYAALSGPVARTALRTNPETAVSFLWAEVTAAEGTIDVVAEAGLLSEPVTPGHLLRGTFWLSGRPMKPARPRRWRLSNPFRSKTSRESSSP